MRTLLVVIALGAGVACQRESPSPGSTQAVVDSAGDGYRITSGSPPQYTPQRTRQIGLRGRNQKGQVLYSLSDLHFAFYASEPNGIEKTEWLELWQLSCRQGPLLSTNCQLLRVQFRGKDRVGALLPHIETYSTFDGTLEIEVMSWEQGTLSLTTRLPLDNLDVRVNFKWAGDQAELISFSAAGTREHFESTGQRVVSVRFRPIDESQVISVPIAIRGLQEPAG